MSSLLNTLFVILVNVIGWGMLVAGVVAFINFFWFMVTDKPSSGRNPHNPNTNSGMPWG